MMRLSRMHHDLISLFEHDLRANAFRVCREGKPVSTFPDHVLAPDHWHENIGVDPTLLQPVTRRLVRSHQASRAVIVFIRAACHRFSADERPARPTPIASQQGKFIGREHKCDGRPRLALCRPRPSSPSSGPPPGQAGARPATIPRLVQYPRSRARHISRPARERSQARPPWPRRPRWRRR